MTNDLNLTLPQRPGPHSGRLPKIVLLLLVALLLVGVANLTLMLMARQHDVTPGNHHAGLDATATRALALKLEKQELRIPAVGIWREYLDIAELSPEEQAKIWYRIGRLRQEAGDHDQALAALYRSEQIAPVAELDLDRNRRIQENLEAGGRFAALGYELNDRLAVTPGDQGGEVLAEIGTQHITRQALDQALEERIKLQLQQQAPMLTPEQRTQQQEILLARFKTPAARSQLLNQMVVEEILYRKAREDGLATDDAVRSQLRQAERAILANQVMAREMQQRVQLTSTDLETYYAAHKADYLEPERIKVSHILVRDEAAAKEVLQRLAQGEDFAKLAKELSRDETTKDTNGDILGWLDRGGSFQGLGMISRGKDLLFATPAGQLVKEPVVSSRGVHVVKVRDHADGKQQAFEAVRDQIHADLRRRKEAEVQEALLADLRQRYDVVIHTSRLNPPADKSEAAATQQ